jgi:hypothetical protein
MTANLQPVGRNKIGRYEGLTALFPIRIGTLPADERGPDRSIESSLRETLASLATDHTSPFAHSGAYFLRMFLLKDVISEGQQPSISTRFVTALIPALARRRRPDHLKSNYLVMVADLDRPIDTFSRDLFSNQSATVAAVWSHCVAYRPTMTDAEFALYVRRCQVNNSLLFLGSTDETVANQLKALSIKQSFGSFVAAHQDDDPISLKAAFEKFVTDEQVMSENGPTWRAGAQNIENVETTI